MPEPRLQLLTTPPWSPTRTLSLQGRDFQVADLPEWEPHIPALTSILEKHITVFPLPGVIAPTITGIPNMTIQLDTSKEGPLPRAHKTRWSETETKVLNEYDDKMTKAGKLEPSMSTTAALPLLVAKPDKTWRIVFNYAPIAGRIIPYVWPLEPTDVVLQKASQWHTITSFDFPLAYHQLGLEQTVRWLTAVVFPRGLRQYTVAPMGWKDSAEHLARGLSQVFDDHLLEGDRKLESALSLFRDDGQIGSMDTIDPANHLKLLDRMLACLQRHNGSLGPSKTFLLMRYIKLLGYTCGQGKQIPDRSKVKAVENWPTPRDQKDIMAFTGFIQFFGHCIPNLAILLRPLNDLRLKQFKSASTFLAEWQRDPKYAIAMGTLKETMTSVTGIHTFNRKRPCILAADGSKQAIGAVAGHACDSSEDDQLTASTKYNPCMFLGRSFRGPELNYSQPEREMLAIVHGVDKIAPYIGTRLVILTDHKAWVYLQNLPSTNKRVDRWKVQLAQLPQSSGYPKFIFRPGAAQGDVDPLSRIDHRDDPDDMDIDARITDLVADPMVLQGLLLLELGWEPYNSIYQWLRDCSLNSSQDQRQQRSIKTKALEYYIFDNQLFKRPKVGCAPRQVPRLRDLSNLLAQFHGDTSSYGHLSAADTYQLLAFRYFWHGMYDHVLAHVDACRACSSRKKKNHSRYELYRITPPPSMFVLLGADTVSLPVGINRHCSITTIIDYTSGLAWSTSSTEPNGRTIIKAFKGWCCRYSYPQWVVVDNGSYFTGGDLPDWARKHGITLLPTSSMHPQANGKIENYNNQFVMLLARRLISMDLPVTRWPELVDNVNFDYNSHLPTTTGISPFSYVFGQTPRLPVENNQLPLPDYTEQELVDLHDSNSEIVTMLRETAKTNLALHRQAAADRTPIVPPRRYTPGDEVWCYKSELDSTHSTLRKVVEKWEGPLTISTAHPGGTYKLIHSDGSAYRRGLTVSHMRLSPVKPKPTLLDFAGSMNT